jgi:prevent-host-death family protein
MTATVSSYEAKTKLAALLRRAEKGETIAITRRGVEIARLAPSLDAELKRRTTAFNKLIAMRKKTKPSRSPEDIRAMIHEGHKW